jgi:diacylglycerol O-acyltransferase
MGYHHSERLSTLDRSFLDLEDRNTHMHIGAVAVLEAGPLRGPNGALDITRVERAIAAGIHRVPRYRQRLAHVPLTRHPVWVDDASFNLHYHLRHTSLPSPGEERQLKRLAGRVFSQQLDRGKPLWELWLVEGLAGDRVALVPKVHHCAIDGVGSVELMQFLMRRTPDPDPRLEQAPPPWVPRPAPSALDLVAGEVGRRLREPIAAAAALRWAARHPREAGRALYERLDGLWEAVSAGLRPASPTPLNVPIGPHRRFDWTALDLAAVKAVKAAAGGTVNDVLLSVLAGALGRFLHRRGLDVAHLDVRAMVPVNVRVPGDEGFGNRVTVMVVRLPLEERAPLRRLERTVAETRARKRSRQAAGMQTMEELGDATVSSLFVGFARLAARNRPFNLVVTNVPGPQFPIYALGARMTACYPLVPLYENQALGVALFSYDGRVYAGFNADWDAVPDLHELVEAVGEEFAALAAVAGTGARAESARGVA